MNIKSFLHTILLLGLLCYCTVNYGQTINFEEIPTEYSDNGTPITEENIDEFNSDNEAIDQVTFKDNLSEKYSGSDFQYRQPEPEKKSSTIKIPEASGFATFMQVLGILAIIIVVFLIAYMILNKEGSWNFKKYSDKTVITINTTINEENVEDMDLESLIKKALLDKNYRLAIRYQYLKTLKHLAQKNVIKYHVKKTNLDYLNELTSEDQKKGFSYLSYLYSYIWYGEFPISETQYTNAEQSFNQFIKNNI